MAISFQWHNSTMIYTVTLNPALDKTCLVDVLEINEISRVRETTYESGGKGFNVSRALSRVGIPNKALGFIGGSYGELILAGLKADHIDVVPVRIHGESRVNQVFISPEGHSIKVNAQGPEILPEEYQSLLSLVKDLAQPEDIWVFSGSLPRNVPAAVYGDLTKVVHHAGGRVFLDSSGASFQEGLNAQPDWIKPNLAEARVVFTGALRKIDLLEDFQALGIGGTILTLGSKGLIYSSGGEIIKIKVPKIENENVVGAGDATVAGFLYGVIQGFSTKKCAKWAAAFGCAAAHAAGNCFDNLGEVEKYYEQLKVEKLDE